MQTGRYTQPHLVGQRGVQVEEGLLGRRVVVRVLDVGRVAAVVRGVRAAAGRVQNYTTGRGRPGGMLALRQVPAPLAAGLAHPLALPHQLVPLHTAPLCRNWTVAPAHLVAGVDRLVLEVPPAQVHLKP